MASLATVMLIGVETGDVGEHRKAQPEEMARFGSGPVTGSVHARWPEAFVRYRLLMPKLAGLALTCSLTEFNIRPCVLHIK